MLAKLCMPFMEKGTVCVCIVRHFSIAKPQLEEAMDQSETLSGLVLRPNSIYQGPILSRLIRRIGSYLVKIKWCGTWYFLSELLYTSVKIN